MNSKGLYSTAGPLTIIASGTNLRLICCHVSILGHANGKKLRRDAWDSTSKCLIGVLQRDIEHQPKAVRKTSLFSYF